MKEERRAENETGGQMRKGQGEDACMYKAMNENVKPDHCSESGSSSHYCLQCHLCLLEGIIEGQRVNIMNTRV